MKMVIALMLVCIGLGVDATGSENAEVALGLCFFFGAIQLVQPAATMFSSFTRAISPKKNHSR